MILADAASLLPALADTARCLERKLLIDPDEPEDWVRDFCHLHSMSERDLEPWS